MKIKSETASAMTDKQIARKLAGYKAGFMRRINKETTKRGKAALEKEMNECIQRKLAEYEEINRRAAQESKKAKWQAAAKKAWETRRANEQRRAEAARQAEENARRNAEEQAKAAEKPAARKPGRKPSAKKAEKPAAKKSSRKYNSSVNMTVKNK